jgi:hypothetical protein
MVPAASTENSYPTHIPPPFTHAAAFSISATAKGLFRMFYRSTGEVVRSFGMGGLGGGKVAHAPALAFGADQALVD